MKRVVDGSIGCRLCTVKRLSKRQQQIHKGICAVEAERVGWVKSFADPLRREKDAVVKASLEFHDAYHYHGPKPRPQGAVVERMKWDEAIAALRAFEKAITRKKGKPRHVAPPKQTEGEA